MKRSQNLGKNAFLTKLQFLREKKSKKKKTKTKQKKKKKKKKKKHLYIYIGENEYNENSFQVLITKSDLQSYRVLQSPSNFILLIVPRRCFCCGSVAFMFWSQIFVLFKPYVRSGN